MDGGCQTCTSLSRLWRQAPACEVSRTALRGGTVTSRPKVLVRSWVTASMLLAWSEGSLTEGAGCRRGDRRPLDVFDKSVQRRIATEPIIIRSIYKHNKNAKNTTEVENGTEATIYPPPLPWAVVISFLFLLWSKHK